VVVITNKPTALRRNRQSSIYIGRGSGISNGAVSRAQKYGPVQTRKTPNVGDNGCNDSAEDTAAVERCAYRYYSPG